MDDTNTQTDVLANIRLRRKSPFALRMAPMIDMIFLLLIFFLVAAKWRPVEDFLPFSLPAAEAQQHRIGVPEPLIIHILTTQTGCEVRLAEKCTVRIDNANIEAGLALLIDNLSGTLAEQKRFAGDPVEIICEQQVKWDYIAKIYNTLFGAGISDITFRMTE